MARSKTGIGGSGTLFSFPVIPSPAQVPVVSAYVRVSADGAIPERFTPLPETANAAG